MLGVWSLRGIRSGRKGCYRDRAIPMMKFIIKFVTAGGANTYYLDQYGIIG